MLLFCLRDVIYYRWRYSIQVPFRTCTSLLSLEESSQYFYFNQTVFTLYLHLVSTTERLSHLCFFVAQHFLATRPHIEPVLADECLCLFLSSVQREG